MEIDSSVYENNSNLIEFPIISTNSIKTICKANNINLNRKSSKYNNKLSKKEILNEELKLYMIHKIAENKINHMNFNNLTSEIINFQKNYITKEDPINIYINHFEDFPKEIEEKNLPLKFINENKEFLCNIKNINKRKQKKENEKFLCFSQNNIKNHCYYFFRMNNVDKKNKAETYEDNIIFIQKNIRGFLIRLKIKRDISRLVVIYIIKNILKIQKAVRNLLNKKNGKKKEIIQIIKKERKSKAKKIIDLFSMYHLRNEYKRNLLIKKILLIRIESANKLYNAIKYYLIRQKIKKIKELQKNNYEILFPFINKKKNIKLKIYYTDKSTKEFNFEFCDIRKINVLYINNSMLKGINNIEHKNEFLCHFFIDDKCVINKRYKIVKTKYGAIYNLIEFKNEYKINNNSIKNDNNKFSKIKIKSIPYKKINILEGNNSFFADKDDDEDYNKSILYDMQKKLFKKSIKINNTKKEENSFFNELSNNNENKHKINSYIDSYNNDGMNYLHSNNKIEHENNLINYLCQTIQSNEDTSENYLGNSSSTISNSYFYKKNYSKTNYGDKKVNENFTSNKINDNKKLITKGKKKDKIFPIFY